MERGMQVVAILVCIFLSTNVAYGQLKIGGNPTKIEASSILELEAQNKGILIPRMNTSQRDSISNSSLFNDSISHGLLVYNTDHGCLNLYDSAQSGRWTNLCRVYLPMTDTSKANDKDPLTGDVIVDSDCDCIMIRDTNDKWRPLIPQAIDWQAYVVNGDSLYMISTAASNGDTLVFTRESRFGIGLANPDFFIDVVATDSLLLRLSEDQLELLTIESGVLNTDSVTLITSRNQPLALRVDDPDSSRYILLDTNGSIDFSKYGRGNFGTKSPSYLLGVDSAGNLVEFTGFTAVSSSDKRLKQDIVSLEGKASELYRIGGVAYRWRTDVHPVKTFEDEITYGVIAQEVEAVFPELVSEDNQGYKMVNYLGFIPLLIENQKKHQKEVQELTAKVQSLEQRIADLETLLSPNE